MDRYLIKIPRAKPQQSEQQGTGPRLVQATIESLQGVVVVEDVLRMKTILKVENQTKENLISALTQLGKKMPSRQVLKSTKIGHTVNKLTKHADDEISERAVALVHKWKTHFEEKRDKPKIEVRSDLKTEKFRSSAISLLAQSLGVPKNHKLVENIEREAFHQCKRLINNSYRRTMRSVWFTLKHQSDIRTQVLNHELSVPDLIVKCKKT